MADSCLKLLVGLGNPGKQYQMTRHNLGFMVIDELCVRLAKDQKPGSFGESDIWACRQGGRLIWLQKPRTYMNRSGSVVADFSGAKDVQPFEIMVIVDDLSLPFGRIRLRSKGSSGGHNGLQSLIDDLESDEFGRLRIGIGCPTGAVEGGADYVLSSFSKSELPILLQVIKISADAVLSAVHRGMTAAMNEFNGLIVPTSTEPASRRRDSG